MGGPETKTPTPSLLYYTCRTQTLVTEMDRTLSRNDDPARRLTRQSRAPTTQPSLRTRVHPLTAQHGPRGAHTRTRATTAAALLGPVSRTRGSCDHQHNLSYTNPNITSTRRHHHRHHHRNSPQQKTQAQKGQDTATITITISDDIHFFC